MNKTFRRLAVQILILAAFVVSDSIFCLAMTAGDFIIPYNVIDTGGTAEASTTHNILTVTGQGSPTGISETSLYRMAMGYIYTLLDFRRPSNLRIERMPINSDEDRIEKKNLNVTIKWDGGMDVDIYTLTPTPEHYYDYNGEWVKEHTTSGVSEWTDTGTDMQKYYRVATKGTTNFALAPSGNIAAVGKFAMDLPYTYDEPTKYLISSPLEPFSKDISIEIGDQAVDGDNVIMSDTNATTVGDEWYIAGYGWLDLFAVQRGRDWGSLSTFEVTPGISIPYWSEGAKTINFVGRVHDGVLVTTLEGQNGADWDHVDTTKWNYVSTGFPRPVDLVNAGLDNVSAGDGPDSGATFAQYDYNASTMHYALRFAYIDPIQWLILVGGSPLMIQPGSGYMFIEPVKPCTTWEETL